MNFNPGITRLDVPRNKWHEFFFKKKQTDLLVYYNAVERFFQNQYSCLEKGQIKGRIYDFLKIPNICGKINKKKLQELARVEKKYQTKARPLNVKKIMAKNGRNKFFRSIVQSPVKERRIFDSTSSSFDGMCAYSPVSYNSNPSNIRPVEDNNRVRFSQLKRPQINLPQTINSPQSICRSPQNRFSLLKRPQSSPQKANSPQSMASRSPLSRFSQLRIDLPQVDSPHISNSPQVDSPHISNSPQVDSLHISNSTQSSSNDYDTGVMSPVYDPAMYANPNEFSAATMKSVSTDLSFTFKEQMPESEKKARSSITTYIYKSESGLEMDLFCDNVPDDTNLLFKGSVYIDDKRSFVSGNYVSSGNQPSLASTLQHFEQSMKSEKSAVVTPGILGFLKNSKDERVIKPVSVQSILSQSSGVSDASRIGQDKCSQMETLNEQLEGIQLGSTHVRSSPTFDLLKDLKFESDESEASDLEFAIEDSQDSIIDFEETKIEQDSKGQKKRGNEDYLDSSPIYKRSCVTFPIDQESNSSESNF